MKFRLFSRPRPLPVASEPVSIAEEADLQQALAQLEARLEVLKAERAALEHLAGLRPGCVDAAACEAVDREFGSRLGGPGWEGLKAWFRGQP